MTHEQLAEKITQAGGSVDYATFLESLDYQERADLATALKNARSAGLITKAVTVNPDGTVAVTVSAVS